MSHGFTIDPTFPCVFVLRDSTSFIILAVYMDDLNAVRTTALCTRVEKPLAQTFEIKVLGLTTFCLGLQIQHYTDGSLLIHQQTYVRKLVRTLKMEEANALTSPMIGRSKTDEDPYWPGDLEEEEVDKTKYLAVVRALLYLATNTGPDIAFSVCVLACHS